MSVSSPFCRVRTDASPSILNQWVVLVLGQMSVKWKENDSSRPGGRNLKFLIATWPKNQVLAY